MVVDNNTIKRALLYSRGKTVVFGCVQLYFEMENFQYRSLSSLITTKNTFPNVCVCKRFELSNETITVFTRTNVHLHYVTEVFINVSMTRELAV